MASSGLRGLHFELSVLAFAVSPAFLPPVRLASPPIRWSHQVLRFHHFWPSSELSRRFRAVLCASFGMRAADPESKVENFDFSC